MHAAVNTSHVSVQLRVEWVLETKNLIAGMLSSYTISSTQYMPVCHPVCIRFPTGSALFASALCCGQGQALSPFYIFLIFFFLECTAPFVFRSDYSSYSAVAERGQR